MPRPRHRCGCPWPSNRYRIGAIKSIVYYTGRQGVQFPPPKIVKLYRIIKKNSVCPTNWFELLRAGWQAWRVIRLFCVLRFAVLACLQWSSNPHTHPAWPVPRSASVSALCLEAGLVRTGKVGELCAMGTFRIPPPEGSGLRRGCGLLARVPPSSPSGAGPAPGEGAPDAGALTVAPGSGAQRPPRLPRVRRPPHSPTRPPPLAAPLARIVHIGAGGAAPAVL